MKHLELHIIQSVPVACLNRDDLNSPKTAIFGGVQRARVSSQSWKRAIREMAKELTKEENSDIFSGERTRRMVYTLQSRLAKYIPQKIAVVLSEKIADIVETIDSKTDADGYKKTKTVMFFSNAEYDAIANAILNSEDVKNNTGALEKALNDLEKARNGNNKREEETAEKDKEKAIKAMGKVLEKGAIAKAIKSVHLKDAADIALFGRMVANDPTLKIDGASMFAHILSTHKVDNEIDFFAAVDDLNKNETGAGMTSTLEFNSATYYRFAALNLDMLANEEHLGDYTAADGAFICNVETRKKVVRTFLKSTILAIPSARKTTMNGNTLPAYVLGIIREKGHPIQLVNAFEIPVYSKQGYLIESINRLNDEYSDLSKTWCIGGEVFKKAVIKESLKSELKDKTDGIVTCSFDNFIEGMVTHVK